MNEETDERLAERLTGHGYGPLLGAYPNRPLVESLKGEPDIAHRLLGVVNDQRAPWRARFLAAEFLTRHVDMTLHARFDHAGLQESYFEALRHNYTGDGVDWGFGKGPNDLGPLGHAAVRLGTEAFVRGLDEAGVLAMNFPWGTPPHFRPPYRVKDFAALVVASARGLDPDLDGGPDERDRAIAELKRTLTYP